MGTTSKGVSMTFVQELMEIIKTKNSWGKNEILHLIGELLVKRYKE
jgi:hypothetical protein